MLLGFAAILLALGCALVMGFAIQRGATCVVAAVDEVVTRRGVGRLTALLEASLWVAAATIVAGALGFDMGKPQAFAVGVSTLVGGALLGLGAVVNRACVFGAIARLGSGEWAYALTPVGFFLGCLLVNALPPSALPAISTIQPWGNSVREFWIAPAVVLVIWRATALIGLGRSGGGPGSAWSPHHATLVIGLAFVIMVLTVGAWAYTDVLAKLARGMTVALWRDLLLFGGLLCGGIFGGWRAGLLRTRAPTLAAATRCLAGGFLMGCGGLLVPGSNDGLILIGAPLLLPHAWVALSTMVVVIWLGLTLQRNDGRPLVT